MVHSGLEVKFRLAYFIPGGVEKARLNHTLEIIPD